MAITINVVLMNSGSRVLLPGVTMALPLSGSIKDVNIEQQSVVGVFSSYSDTYGCSAEVLDLTILPNGMPGMVVRGKQRIKMLGKRRVDGQFTFGAIKTLPCVDGALDISPTLLNAFLAAVSCASFIRRTFPKFKSAEELTAVDLYAIANKLCNGLDRIGILKAENVDAIFALIKDAIPGASLFSLPFGSTTASQPVL